MVRKIFLGLGVALLAVGLFGLDAEAKSKKGEVVLRIRLSPPPDRTLAATPFGGDAFYVAGTICKEKNGPACTDAGDFHCWGWRPATFPDGTAPAMGFAPSVVSQLFEIDGRGTISVQGVEAFGAAFVPRAVDGGTGDFRNARGEMTSAEFTAVGELTVTFKLIGAKK